MAIDPRRTRRGLAERYAVPSSVLTYAVVVVLGQAWPCTADAQLVIPDVSGAYGAPWRFGASISADEQYSDNINLTSTNQRSDLVTTITPGLVLTRSSRRLDVAFDYSPQVVYYARGSNGFQVRNTLDARLSASIIENLLYFDATSNIQQGNISPFGTQAADSVNGSNNRVESRSYSFGPTRWARTTRRRARTATPSPAAARRISSPAPRRARRSVTWGSA
jgi:hypothetical protein